MLGDQSLLNDVNGLMTDRMNNVCLLCKGAIPQLKSLGRIVFRYGSVVRVIITFDCNSAW